MKILTDKEILIQKLKINGLKKRNLINKIVGNFCSNKFKNKKFHIFNIKDDEVFFYIYNEDLDTSEGMFHPAFVLPLPITEEGGIKKVFYFEKGNIRVVRTSENSGYSGTKDYIESICKINGFSLEEIEEKDLIKINDNFIINKNKSGKFSYKLISTYATLFIISASLTAPLSIITGNKNIKGNIFSGYLEQDEISSKWENKMSKQHFSSKYNNFVSAEGYIDLFNTAISLGKVINIEKLRLEVLNPIEENKIEHIEASGTTLVSINENEKKIKGVFLVKTEGQLKAILQDKPSNVEISYFDNKILLKLDNGTIKANILLNKINNTVSTIIESKEAITPMFYLLKKEGDKYIFKNKFKLK